MKNKRLIIILFALFAAPQWGFSLSCELDESEKTEECTCNQDGADFPANGGVGYPYNGIFSAADMVTFSQEPPPLTLSEIVAKCRPQKPYCKLEGPNRYVCVDFARDFAACFVTECAKSPECVAAQCVPKIINRIKLKCNCCNNPPRGPGTWSAPIDGHAWNMIACKPNNYYIDPQGRAPIKGLRPPPNLIIQNCGRAPQTTFSPGKCGTAPSQPTAAACGSEKDFFCFGDTGSGVVTFSTSGGTSVGSSSGGGSLPSY